MKTFLNIFASVLFVSVPFFASCSAKSSILGKWEQPDQGQKPLTTLEFFQDGTLRKTDQFRKKLSLADALAFRQLVIDSYANDPKSQADVANTPLWQFAQFANDDNPNFDFSELQKAYPAPDSNGVPTGDDVAKLILRAFSDMAKGPDSLSYVGKYSFMDNNHLKLEFENFGLVYSKTVELYAFAISDDTLTLTNLSNNTVLSFRKTKQISTGK